MGDDPELSAERDHLHLARECLVAMTASAERIADYGVDELASHALGRLRAERLESLRADPHAPPFFGRCDMDGSQAPRGDRDPDDAAPHGGRPEVLHIGRRHVRDAAGDPVVIDWRAPLARPFYRATAADRQGVRLRRRFGFRATEAGPLITSYEDEHLDRGEALGLASDLLREEIERPRVGPMRDIVATIQPDQDELVRAELATSLCVQGAPGTGKTAVGLHRAAYLLYTYPDRLRRTGVLVVGPNQAFLHYIAQVLPSLGEGGIEQTTVDQLVGADGPDGEPAALATLKGDARMAAVLRRAVLSHVAKPTEDLVAVVGTRRYRVGAHHLRRYVDDARRAVTEQGLRWSTARGRLRMQIAEDVRRQREDAGGAPSDAETAKLARSAPVREYVDAVWPPLAAAALLTRLYDDAAFLARCARTELTADEQALLHRPRRATAPEGRSPARSAGNPRSRRRVRWSAADAVLLDELAGLLEDTASYVHVVIDEAQDLSPMQCRAIARRCPLGSVTVLGDLAQATTPWAPGDWTLTLHHLGHPVTAGTVLRPLTAGYRVPGAVLEVANRLLPHIAAGVPPATSVRTGRDALRFAAARALVAEVRRCLDEPGSVAVIVPDARAAAVLAQLRADGLAADPLADDSDARLTVVPASAAKGLEYDSVVLLEPEEMVAAEPDRASGLRRLYVVLTRAVSRLTVAHDAPLPAELLAAAAGGAKTPSNG